jgi:dihydroorotase
MSFDLLVKGGHVIDPSLGYDDVLDIAICEGKIAQVEPTIEPSLAKKVIRIDGQYISPGWIDVHVHLVDGLSYADVNPDIVGVRMGVTSLADGGTCGAATFPAFRRYVEQTTKSDVYLFIEVMLLYVASPDFITHRIGASKHKGNIDLKRTLKIFAENQDMICGFKVRPTAEHKNDTESLMMDAGLELSRITGAPLLVHLGSYPFDGWLSAAEVFRRSQPGDIITHCFRRNFGILDENGKVLPEVKDAVERGVLLDIGHSNSLFDFETMQRALDQGLKPHLLSTDIFAHSLDGNTPTMAETAVKMMASGLNLSEIIRMNTIDAAQALRIDSTVGSLTVGKKADLTIFSLEDGEWLLSDSFSRRRYTGARILPQLTVKDGQVIPVDIQEVQIHKNDQLTVVG